MPSPVEIVETVTLLLTGVRRWEAIASLTIQKGVTLVRAVEIEGVSTQTCLPRPQETPWAMAASYRSYDLTSGETHHVAGPIIRPFGRQHTRGLSLRERDKVRMPSVAHAEAETFEVHPTRPPIAVGMTDTGPACILPITSL